MSSQKGAPGSALAFHTTFNATTWNGLSKDVVTSGLQKYLRRREWDKMAWMAIELYLFIEIDAQPILTNLVTRLGVMATEELLFADVDRFLQVHRRLSAWDRTDLMPILEVCQLLIQGRLLRLTSDLNTVYHTAPQYGLGLSLWDPERKIADVSEWARPGDDQAILSHLGRFVTSLEAGLDEVFHWADQITSSGLTGARRYRRTGAEYILWDVLYAYAPNDKAVEILDTQLAWYHDKARRERPIFLLGAILIVLNQNTIDWTTVVAPTLTTDEVEQRLADVVAGRVPTIDDYVVDMHTREGRRLGRSRSAFASEGALVVDEDKEHFSQQYRDLYVKVKELQGDGRQRAEPGAKAEKKVEKKAPPGRRGGEEKKVETKAPPIPAELVLYSPEEKLAESDIFASPLRAQLVCSASRTDSYFATLKGSDQLVFVKGPFRELPDSLLSVQLRQSLDLEHIPLSVAYLRPDLLTTALGVRTSLDPSRTYPFLVSTALCTGPLPTKMHSSKVWPPTQIVDWEQVTEPVAFRPMEYPDQLDVYAEHLMYRYLVGSGDLADRNFLLTSEGTVYAIDEDRLWGEVDLASELKAKKFDLLTTWLTTHRKALGETLDRWLGTDAFRALLIEVGRWEHVQAMAAQFRRYFLGEGGVAVPAKDGEVKCSGTTKKNEPCQSRTKDPSGLCSRHR